MHKHDKIMLSSKMWRITGGMDACWYGVPCAYIAAYGGGVP